MANGEQEGIPEIRRRLRRAESELDDLRRLHTNGTFLRSDEIDDKLRIVEKEISMVDMRLDTFKGNLDTVTKTDTRRSLLVYGAIITGVVSIIVTLLLSGVGL